MTWDLSCPDWQDRMRTGRSLVPDLPLNATEADRAVAVFNKLRLADVPGTPTMAEAGGDWFRDVVRALFGALDPHTRERVIREFFLLVAKKNAKTTFSALLMLVALLLNFRPRAPFIMTAPVQDVADLAFSAVSGAIALDPVLQRVLYVREHLKTVVHRETKAELQIMTFDPAVLTGQKVAGALIDELHVVSKMSKADKAIRQLRGGMIPFPEAFLVFITTQSEDAPAGVFRDELIKARQIRDGKIEGSAMLPVLYEFPPQMQADPAQWKDSAHWHMVTPNLGRSITIKRLEQDMRAAEQTSEGELRAWASQHLNVEIGLALHANGWAGAEFWLRRAIPGGMTLQDLIERSEVITIGIDGGGLDDLLGFAVLGRDQHGHWGLWCRAWAHPSVLQRRKAEAPRFMDFAAAGELVLVDQIGDDIDELVELVSEVDASGKLHQVGVDPAGIGAIVQALNDAGIGGEDDEEEGDDGPRQRIVGISQGWKLMGAIKTTERKLAEGKLHHAGQALMAWCAGNAKVEPKGNAVLITKQASGSAKIDPLMATFNAVALMSMNPAARGRSWWEELPPDPTAPGDPQQPLKTAFQGGFLLSGAPKS